MSFWSRLRRTLRPDRHNNEIEEELRYHLAMKEQEGMAAREARLRFGNATSLKDETRAQGIFTWLDLLLRDLRYGVRQLLRNRTLSAVVILSLALGIGANSAIFTLLDTALLKPLPVRDAGTLRAIWWRSQGWPETLCNMLSGETAGDSWRDVRGSSVSLRVYRELAQRPAGFSAIVGFSDAYDVSVSSGKHAAEQFSMLYASPNFFAELGVQPALGRSFSTGEDRTGGRPVVVISDRFWRRWFQGRADVLGQVLRVNNVPVEVIGVAPPHFFGLQVGNWVDFYAPLAAQIALNPRERLDTSLGANDTFWWVRMLARLDAGTTEHGANSTLARQFQRSVLPPGMQIDRAKLPTLFTLPGERGVNSLHDDQSRALWIIFLLVGLILLIVCANVANLLLARAVARQRESAVCLALGAARTRLFRQSLLESSMLALAGGLAGLLLNVLLTRSMESFLQFEVGFGGFDLRMDWRMLVFTAAATIAAALLFGTAPAILQTRASVNEALKTNSRSVFSGRLRLPRALVAAQVALSFTVLALAGLLGRSLTNLERVSVGFQRENLLYVSVNPWSAGYEAAQVQQYIDRLRERFSALPGVMSAALIGSRPLSGSVNVSTMNIPGRPFQQGEKDMALVNTVSDGLFETLGVKLVTGRTFRLSDIQPKVESAIVDEQFADHFFGRTDPIGRVFGMGPKPDVQYRVVGVVKNNRYYSLREAYRPTFYLPYRASARPGSQIHFVLRASRSQAELARGIQRAAAEIDSAVPVTAIKTQNALVDQFLLTERLLRLLSTAFGFLALLLCAVGITGLLAYTVARRKNEIGVRMALGASARQVVGLVVGESVALIAMGIAVGLPGAYALGRLLRDALFGLEPADPVSLALPVLALVIVAALAAWIPSRRAAHIAPMEALREE